ncbi:hypothetical protein E0H64_26085 [Rhizobium leguminosarum bv. viciae]|nr:hypothetical protein E0H64_26085 [Rhizobium leguminosarum bv. viciae]
MSPTSASLQKSGVAAATQPVENLSNISRIKKPRYRPETGHQIMPDVDATEWATITCRPWQTCASVRSASHAQHYVVTKLKRKL